MDIKVQGNQTLSGEIHPSGYKNSIVALIPASIIFDKPVTYTNVPDITDVAKLVEILQKLGSKIDWDKKENVMKIDNSKISFDNLTKEELGNMRGVSLLWGPMLARFGKVKFYDLPGGCKLGYRSLMPHFEAFEALGVEVVENGSGTQMKVKSVKASEVFLTEMSPTATENVIMLAVGLEGKTKIVGAASEPQVQDLCNFLVKCGANIAGVGSSVLVIEGGKPLTPQTHRIISDDYEVATFISLVASTGGELTIHDTNPFLFKPMEHVFSKFGVNIEYDGTKAYIAPNQKIEINAEKGRGYLQIKAQPWPGLLVDTLPLYIPLALAAKRGQALFHNWMYDGGLFWTSELHRLGANIIMCDPHRVLITAGTRLVGAKMEAPYIIRGVVALTMAAMIAEGESTILDADALYRGHPRFAENLRSLGAKIEEIGENKRKTA